MSTTAGLNKATTSSAAASTVSSTTGGAPTTVVQGESAPSVVVQSQLATSTVDAKGITHRSNLNQIVGDLGAAHQAHSGWLESEMLKVSEWGNTEIQRLMVQTKGVEERLVAEAQAQQKLLEESHKGDLARLVQELDAKKAMRLKELEDGLQRQIQAALNTSKKDINAIESEMNKRKMALMTQAQLQTAKDVDRLSNLSVEARLVPSTTRTIIETNTSTGTVIAVAGGGEISTGQASAQSVRTENIVAAPTAGTLTQTTDVKTGDIRRNDNDAKVGTGAIVSTMTDVQQRPAVTQPIAGTASTTLGQTHTTAPLASTASTTGPAHINLPIGHQGAGGNITTTATTGTVKHVDAAYGRDIKPAHDVTYDKTHHATTEPKHKEGLLSKVKHAITGEPKSSQAHNTRV